MDGWGEDGAHGAVPALYSTTCTIVCYRFRGRIAPSRQVCFLIGWISVLTCTNQQYEGGKVKRENLHISPKTQTGL